MSIGQPGSSRGARECAQMGVACAFVGALVGVGVAVSSVGIGHAAFAVAAPLAGLLCGTGAWWLVVVRASRYARWRGALAGALAAVVAHYVCWYVVLLSAFVAQALSKTPPSHGQEVFGPIGAIVWAIGPTVFSLLLFGGLTVPAGALIGTVLVSRQRKVIGAHDMRVNPATS